MTFVSGVSTTATDGRLYVLDGQALCVSPASAVPTGDARDPAWVYLGALDGEPCFARALAPGEAPPTGTSAVALRQLFGVLSDEEFGVAGRALGLTAWDSDFRHCGRCGTQTVRAPAERVRACPTCKHLQYPRLSPAVIMLVERDGHALLARNARFPLAFHSCLAGFVEVGESLEETVAREVAEEVGVRVADVRYFGSQPWPFSGSLMVGFTARWASGELAPDGDEIAEAGWFTPHALPRVPPSRLSISRALIDDFVRRHGGEPPAE